MQTVKEVNVELELTGYINDNPTGLIQKDESGEVEIFIATVTERSIITGLGTTGSFIDGLFYAEDLEDISKLLTAKNVSNEVMYNEDKDMIKIVFK